MYRKTGWAGTPAPGRVPRPSRARMAPRLVDWPALPPYWWPAPGKSI